MIVSPLSSHLQKLELPQKRQQQQQQRSDALIARLDLIFSLVLPHLDVPTISRLFRVSVALKNLVSDDRLWRFLCERDFDLVLPTNPTKSWKARYASLVTLTGMQWETASISSSTSDPAAPFPAPNISDEENKPLPRWGHSFVALDAFRILLFGGESHAPRNDVYVLHLGVPFRWERISCQGELPCPRFGHSGVMYGKKTFVVFGGSKGSAYVSDLQCLDTQTWTWSQPAREEKASCWPSARSSHSMTLVREMLYLFGGIGVKGSELATNCRNDFYVLDPKTWIWQQIYGVGAGVPQARFVHRAAAVENKIFIFGGRTEEFRKFNDVHWFDTVENQWHREEVVDGVPPAPRGGHACVAIGSSLIVFCGREQGDGCVYDGLYRLQTATQPMRWSRRDDVPGLAPAPRGACGATACNGQLVVFGGFGSNGTYERDVHVLRLLDETDDLDMESG